MPSWLVPCRSFFEKGQWLLSLSVHWLRKGWRSSSEKQEHKTNPKRLLLCGGPNRLLEGAHISMYPDGNGLCTEVYTPKFLLHRTIHPAFAQTSTG